MVGITFFTTSTLVSVEISLLPQTVALRSWNSSHFSYTIANVRLFNLFFLYNSKCVLVLSVPSLLLRFVLHFRNIIIVILFSYSFLAHFEACLNCVVTFFFFFLLFFFFFFLFLSISVSFVPQLLNFTNFVYSCVQFILSLYQILLQIAVDSKYNLVSDLSFQTSQIHHFLMYFLCVRTLILWYLLCFCQFPFSVHITHLLLWCQLLSL